MNNQFDSNHIKKEEFIINNYDNDYEILISKLKEIGVKIATLEKQYSEKF